MNHWEILGLAPTNDVKEIKRAYAKHLKALDLSREMAAFQVLREAYEKALATVKGVKREQIPGSSLESSPSAPDASEAQIPVEPSIRLEAEKLAREKKAAREAALLDLTSHLKVQYGEQAWKLHSQYSIEAGRASFDGTLQWEQEVFSRLLHWVGSPFPGFFAEQFARHAEIFRDIKFQQDHPYAFFLFYEKLASYRTLLAMINKDSKSPAWAFILASRSGADHEKAARNLGTWVAVRSFLVTLEDEYPDMLHTMLHQDTLTFWRLKIRSLPPLWSARGFLWGIWGVIFLPFIMKTSLAWDMQKEYAGVHILWTFAAGYFHRWLFYALANLLRYGHITRLDGGMVKVFRQPNMRVVCFITAIAAIVCSYLLPSSWAGILPLISLFAAWLALGPSYYQMAIPNGVIAMIFSADLIKRLPQSEVFLSTFVPFMYLALGILYFMRMGYAQIVDRLPDWIPPTARGFGLFIASGLVLRFGLLLILKLSGS